MSDTPLKVAVIGVGHLGSIHAKIYSEYSGAELVGVVDHDLEHIDRLGFRPAAVLGIAHHVGQRAGYPGMNCRYAVYACQAAEPACGRADVAVVGEIRPDRHLGVGPERQKPAIVVEREFGIDEDGFDDDGLARVWIDGSFINSASGWKAGIGIFYGSRSERNVSTPVDAKTAERAELTALAEAIERDGRSLRVGVDCQRVARGFADLQNLAARAWLRKPPRGVPIVNSDLWRRVHATRRRRSERGLRTDLCWRRGHARPCHIEDGSTTKRDAWANARADALAVAAHHPLQHVSRSRAVCG